MVAQIITLLRWLRAVSYVQYFKYVRPARDCLMQLTRVSLFTASYVKQVKIDISLMKRSEFNDFCIFHDFDFLVLIFLYGDSNGNFLQDGRQQIRMTRGAARSVAYTTGG